MLNDDTADSILFHHRKLCRNALQFHGNLLTHGFGNHSDVQIWGGDSLSLKPGTIPVVSGKYGFSDSADPLHLGFGGRLGNRYLGGVLFLAAGWETVHVTNNLLRNFELSIQPVMLGPVPWRYPLLPETFAIQKPDFKEAWPIKILNSQTTIPFYTFENYTLTTITRKGEGRFVLIGDHRFFIAENLEEERTGRPENVRFFRELMLEVVRNGDY